MWTPSQFEVEDPALIRDFLETKPFGVLISSDATGTPEGTHLPFLMSFDSEGRLWRLQGHMAATNPHRGRLALGREVLVIFQGPHAYV